MIVPTRSNLPTHPLARPPTRGLWAIVCLLALLVLAGCVDRDPRPDSTREMATELREILDQMAPERNPFLNARRAAMIRNLPPPPDPGERVGFRASLAQELLQAGDTEAAIAIFEELEEIVADAIQAGQPGAVEMMHELERLLALSWLRLGEQENCIANPTSASCIVPISEEGWHQIETGSRNAIEYYHRVLERSPDDLNARWLLNLAHMTLGEYPHGVEPEWLIPPAAFEAEDDIGRFWEIAPHLGVDVAELSGGAIVEDLTGNGFLDIMTSSWHLAHQIRLFENNGDGTFTDVTDQAGLTGITGGLHITHGDYTNNGRADVFVLRGAWMGEQGRVPNSLLRNNGDGTFTDVTREAGVYSRRPTQTAVWADFNGNGRLDLFVGNETLEGSEHPAELFLNNGDGTFTEAAREAGVAVVGFVKGVTAGDIDNDGRPDLYVSKRGEPNLLFRNDGLDDQGIPTFTEIGESAGVQEPLASFPAWFWDYDNDGFLDLLVFGYHVEPDAVAAEYLGQEVRATMPRLYRNNGDGTFTDVTAEQGLDRVMYTMGSNFGDFDNDGWLDFLVGTGDPDLGSLMPNRAFRNDAGGRFLEITTSGGFGNVQKGHAVAFGDLNNNGLQDVYMNLGGAMEGDVYQNAFYENPGHGNDWVTLRFHGTRSNRLGMGTRIRVEVQEGGGAIREIHRVVGGGGSFGGNTLQAEIGLGPAATIREIEVFWPASGIRQRFSDVATNRIYMVREDAEELDPVEAVTFSYRIGPLDPHEHR